MSVRVEDQGQILDAVLCQFSKELFAILRTAGSFSNVIGPSGLCRRTCQRLLMPNVRLTASKRALPVRSSGKRKQPSVHSFQALMSTANG
jgi:hypothetical protein